MPTPAVISAHWRMSNWLRCCICAASFALITGCGFYLRGRLTLPPDMTAIRIQSSTPYSALVKLLRQTIRASKIAVTDDETATAGATTVGQLTILTERWGDLAISIDNHGRAQEYSVRYATLFTLVDGKDRVIVPQQMIELSRDYLSPPQDATGTATEREILSNELRREMAAAILRRVDSVVRQRMQAPQAAISDHALPAAQPPVAVPNPPDAPSTPQLPAAPPQPGADPVPPNR